MSPGDEVNLNNMLLTQVHRDVYDQLIRLDVLGLQNTATSEYENVYNEFKEQPSRSEEGCTRQAYHEKATTLSS